MVELKNHLNLLLWQSCTNRYLKFYADIEIKNFLACLLTNTFAFLHESNRYKNEVISIKNLVLVLYIHTVYRDIGLQ